MSKLDTEALERIFDAVRREIEAAASVAAAQAAVIFNASGAAAEKRIRLRIKIGGHLGVMEIGDAAIDAAPVVPGILDAAIRDGVRSVLEQIAKQQHPVLDQDGRNVVEATDAAIKKFEDGW